MSDSVNSPPHYQNPACEVIDFIAGVLGPRGFEAYCIGNVIKYVSRYQWKGGIEDLRKARVYLEWAIGEEEAEEAEPVTLADLLAENQADELPLRAGGTD